MINYKLSVAAIFKNEAFNLKEWVDHYIHHGVEHFYLVNDNSSDEFLDILTPYINSGIITLYDSDVGKFSNRQQAMYDKYILTNVKNSEWTIICDLDEFIYSPKDINILNIINKYKEYDILYLNWAIFGTNGNVDHPESIVKTCTKRIEYNGKIYALCGGSYNLVDSCSRKYIINNKANLSGLWVHDPVGSYTSINVSYMGALKNDCDLIMNHYITQSKEFWEKVKMTRGDVNNHHPDNARDWTYFNYLDIGDIDDLRLKEQNKNI